VPESFDTFVALAAVFASRGNPHLGHARISGALPARKAVGRLDQTCSKAINWRVTASVPAPGPGTNGAHRAFVR
jgi:hypothetical protein